MACGNPQPAQFDPATCVLTTYNAAGQPQAYNLFDAFLAKLEFPANTSVGYDCDLHALTVDGVTEQLKCGMLAFDPLLCQLSYTDEKQQIQSFFIPQDQFVYDTATCTLTILDAKGNPAIVVPTGVPSSEVGLAFVKGPAGPQLELTYKDKVCQIGLPNMVVGTTYNSMTNALSVLYCDGSEVEHAMGKAALECLTLDNGQRVFCFTDGFGGKKLFDIPAITLDTDDLTVNGSVLVFEYGGDGNEKTVTVDICDIVANNCNATITATYPDGGFDFIDNAGNPFQIRPVNCCTYFGINNTILDPNTPPGSPAGTYPNKIDRDTVIECHPNGLSFWTCVEGALVHRFSKTFENQIHHFVQDAAPIDPANPPTSPPNVPVLANKNSGDTVLVCHANGFCAYTCVGGVWARRFCKVIPEVWLPVSNDGSVTITDLGNGEYNFSVEVVQPIDPEKETFKAGDTLPDNAQVVQVCLADGTVETVGPGSTLPLTMIGCVQVDETDGTTGYIPPKTVATPLEVFIGSTQPEKSSGFTTWFDPIACVARFCDNQGGWLEPRAVVCSLETPPCAKGGPTLWFNPGDGCLSVQCETEGECIWVGATGGLIRQVIEQLCVQVGAGEPIPLEVNEDGKVVIPVPAPTELPTFAVQVGDGAATTIELVDGRIVIPVPEPGCCSYNLQSEQALGGDVTLDPPTGAATKNPGDTALVKHPNGLSAWRCTDNGYALDWTCPIGQGLTKEDLLHIGNAAPAEDSTQCFWQNPETGCFSVLTDDVWMATNGTDAAPAS